MQHVLAKTHIFDFAGKRCNRTPHQKSYNYRKAKLLKNDNDFHQNWSTNASKFTSKNRFFIIFFLHDYKDADFESIQKTQGFTLYSPHWFPKSMLLKTTKKQRHLWSIQALHKITQNWKYQYYVRPLTNSPPKKEKTGLSKGHSDPLLLLYVYSNIQYFTYFCYTSLLIFNISLYGTFPISLKIIKFCNTSLLKHTFSIFQEFVAIAHFTKNHVIIGKQNY